MNSIAKYRKHGNDEEWFLTNFTMEQVESHIANLEKALAEAKEEIARLTSGERELLERYHDWLSIYGTDVELPYRERINEFLNQKPEQGKADG